MEREKGGRKNNRKVHVYLDTITKTRTEMRGYHATKTQTTKTTPWIRR